MSRTNVAIKAKLLWCGIVLTLGFMLGGIGLAAGADVAQADNFRSCYHGDFYYQSGYRWAGFWGHDGYAVVHEHWVWNDSNGWYFVHWQYTYGCAV